MSCISTQLAELAPTIEAQLKPSLSGLTGMIVRGYLPQTWIFRAEGELATLVVSKDGAVAAYNGTMPDPDVLVETSHRTLSAALSAGLGRTPRSAVPRDPVTPTFYTGKGRTAFGYLRGRLGL